MDLTIGVLALQGDVREHLLALAELGVLARPVRRAEELESVHALVVPGGESTTMSKLAVDFGLLEPVRKRIAEGMPAYGSCAGMIMLGTTVLEERPVEASASAMIDGRPTEPSAPLASSRRVQTFGGIDMVVRRNAFGRQVDSFETDVVLDGIEGRAFRTVFIRAPWAEEVGPQVEVLGRIEGGPADGRIVAVRQGRVMATAFHPEVTGDLRVHEAFVDLARGVLSSADE